MFPLLQCRGTDAKAADDTLKKRHLQNDNNKSKVNRAPTATNES